MNALIGVYLPRDSVLHRLPAWTKLLVLFLGCLALLFVRTWWTALIAAGIVALAYVVGKIGIRAAWAQVRPLRWFVPVLFVLQLVLAGPAAATALTIRVVLAVALAGLVTVTTRTSDLLAVFERLLPARFALLLALTVRSIPVLATLAGTIREAQRARGHEHDIRAFAVPMLAGTLRRADTLGEALRARGLDD